MPNTERAVIYARMIPPPKRVITVTFSPIPSQTQIGANTTYVKDKSMSSSAGTKRAPNVKSVRPTPNCTTLMTRLRVCLV